MSSAAAAVSVDSADSVGTVNPTAAARRSSVLRSNGLKIEGRRGSGPVVIGQSPHYATRPGIERIVLTGRQVHAIIHSRWATSSRADQRARVTPCGPRPLLRAHPDNDHYTPYRT